MADALARLKQQGVVRDVNETDRPVASQEKRQAWMEMAMKDESRRERAKAAARAQVKKILAIMIPTTEVRSARW
jgi:hypothetical protein